MYVLSQIYGGHFLHISKNVRAPLIIVTIITSSLIIRGHYQLSHGASDYSELRRAQQVIYAASNK